MLIKYESVHGDYFVEVDDNWGELALGDSEVTYNGKQVQISDAKELDALIAEFDRIDSNADRIVRRHGYSLDKIVDDNTSVRLPKGLVITADTQREAELRDFRERALATLSPENRKLWCQIHIQGLTSKEAAELAGVTSRAINRRLSRIKDTLLEYYEKNFL